MAPTKGRFAMRERRWDCRRSSWLLTWSIIHRVQIIIALFSSIRTTSLQTCGWYRMADWSDESPVMKTTMTRYYIILHPQSTPSTLPPS